jgi:pantoate--beta-alanine ligase
MDVIYTISNLIELRNQISSKIGLVPTMGAIHSGHKSLIDQSVADNEYTVSTIFVNPKQFGKNEDFNHYPRSLEQDLNFLEDNLVDCVFIPESTEMYKDSATTIVSVGEIGNILEGAQRPGHFDGVALVVTKLLNLVRPTTLYLGQKDYQQTQVIKSVINDLNLHVHLKICPTVRESDGLAISSRNVYLETNQRKSAGGIYSLLELAKLQKQQFHWKEVSELEKELIDKLLNIKHITQVNYLQFVNPYSLQPAETLFDPAVLLLSVNMGSVRLIDNIMC